MAELIGKGCECIYDFEKHYLAEALESKIANEAYYISTLEERVAKRKRGDISVPALLERIQRVKEFLGDLEVVQERLEVTPLCLEPSEIIKGLQYAYKKPYID